MLLSSVRLLRRWRASVLYSSFVPLRVGLRTHFPSSLGQTRVSSPIDISVEHTITDPLAYGASGVFFDYW
jgi:hypothetical protein